jgi:transcription antitermination factor NusA-like protein
MGLLIGPRGSNQKRLQEMSGAHIVIRGEHSRRLFFPRTVDLTGRLENACDP